MRFFGSAVGVSVPAKGHDAAAQDAEAGVAVDFGGNGPRTAFAPLFFGLARDAARPGDVKDENAARPQGVVSPAEESNQSGAAVPLVKGVVEALADGRDGVAARDFSAQQRSHFERGARRDSPGQPDHGGRLIDSQHAVSGAFQFASPAPAATTEVDYQPAGDSLIAQDPEKSRSEER